MTASAAVAVNQPKSIRARSLSALRRFGLVLLAAYFVLGALFLLTRYLILPELDRWRPELEQILSSQIGKPVRITGLRGDIEGLSPAIFAERISIGEAGEKPLFDATGVAAVLSWRTLLSGKPNFDLLQVDTLKISAKRLSRRQLQVAGFHFNLPESRAAVVSHVEGNARRWHFPDWLLTQQGLHFRRVDIDFEDVETGAQARLERLEVKTHETDGRRELLIDASPESDLHGRIVLRAALSRTDLAGNLGVPDWRGEAYLELNDLALGPLHKLLREPLPVSDGSMTVKAWFALRNSAPFSARIEFSGNDIGFGPAAVDTRFRSASANIDARWQANGAMHLDIQDASVFDRDGVQLAIAQSAATARFDRNMKPVGAQFEMQAFNAERFLALMRRLPLPDDLKSHFAKLELQGRIDKLKLKFNAEQKQTAYRIDSSFENLSVSYGRKNGEAAPTVWRPQFPAGERISGDVSITERGGTLSLNGTHSRLRFPGIMAYPDIAIDSILADLDWTITPSIKAAQVNSKTTKKQPSRGGLDIFVRRLELANADASLSLSGTYRNAKNSPGIVNFKGGIRRAQVDKVYRYLPLKMKPDVRAWIRSAFVAGHSDDVTFEVKGNLRDYPFRKPSRGKFLLLSDVKDAEFRFDKLWPSITGLDAIVRIEQGGLSVKSSRGDFSKLRLDNGSAVVADFRKAELAVEMQTHGKTQHLIGLINKTPLARLIDGFLAKSRASGKTDTRIKLQLPLRHPELFKLAGKTSFDRASIYLTDFLPRLSRVRGDLEFNERGLHIDGLKARALGGPIAISAHSPEKGRLEMQFSGSASAAGLRLISKNLITDSLHGRSNYSANLTLNRGAVDLRVNSQLQGMAIVLPAPFDKVAGKKMPLKIRLRPLALDRNGRARSDEMSLKLGKNTRMIFRRSRTKKGFMRVRRGVLALGEKPVLPATGMNIVLSGQAVDADGWSEALGLGAPASAQGNDALAIDSGFFKDFVLVPRNVIVVAPEVKLFGRKFHDLTLGASRENTGWKANVRTRGVNGYLKWQGPSEKTPAGSVLGRFTRLMVPREDVHEIEAIFTSSPQSLPRFDITADEFELLGKKLGRLTLKAKNVGQTGDWEIRELSLEHPAARLASSGVWHLNPRGSRETQMRFDLDLRDAGEWLSVLGMPDVLLDGIGKLSGDIKWRGSPMRLNLPTLTGGLSLTLGRGQFLKTEPGIAKLIGVLSLQSIPRRLNLDFSDVFARGFAFDAIVGTATISGGVARTDNMLMHGIQAEVLIDGHADTVNETQDLNVRILPTINAGLASIAYAAAVNPALGLGTLLAQVLLSKPLKELFAIEVGVTGSWLDPVVTEIKRPDTSPTDNSLYAPG